MTVTRDLLKNLIMPTTKRTLRVPLVYAEAEEKKSTKELYRFKDQHTPNLKGLIPDNRGGVVSTVKPPAAAAAASSNPNYNPYLPFMNDLNQPFFLPNNLINLSNISSLSSLGNLGNMGNMLTMLQPSLNQRIPYQFSH